MRSITAAIDKILKENEGARVLLVATSTIRIVSEKHAIMDACAIFDLTEMVESAEKDDNTKKKKVQITEPIKLFCKENNINCINYTEGTVFFYSSMKHISTAVSMILEANKGIKVKCLKTTTVRVNKGEEFVNACTIFENDTEMIENNNSNDVNVQITKSIKLYCDNHNVTICDNGDGKFCMTGSMRQVSATISKILEANKGSKVKDLKTAKMEIDKDKENRKGITIVNANVSFC